MSRPLSSQIPGDFQESTKDQGAWTYTWAQPLGGDTWGRPGSCCLQVPCCCHILRKGPNTHLGGLTSRVFLPNTPPPQTHLWSQALGHQHPLVATPHLFPSSLPGLAPEGPLPPASMGVVGPQGAVRDLHTNLYLLENCPQTVLKMDQGPSSSHLTPSSPHLSPVLQEALPRPPLEGLGYFSPKVKLRQGLRIPVSCLAVGGHLDNGGRGRQALHTGPG